MSSDPQSQNPFAGLIGRVLEAAAQLKNQFLFFAVLVLVLSIVAGMFVPQWLDKGGRGLLYTLTGLAFLAFLVGLFEPALSARLTVKKETGQGKDAAQKSAPEAETTQPANHPTLSPDALRACYLESLVADCCRARLIGVDPSASDPSRGGMTLESLYVALDTKTQVEIKEKEKKRERQDPLADRQSRPLSALEALARAPNRQIVLLGLPGAGKSTFVRYLILRMAQALIDPSRNLAEDLPGWTRRPLLPLIVSLGRLAESIPAGSERGSAEWVERFIRATLDADKHLKGYGDALLDELRRDGGLVCFDGLDEVASLDMRPVVRESVEAFAVRYGRNGATTCLVTCRTFSYTDARWELAGWPVYELAPFDPDRIRDFVNAWHDELQRIDPAGAENYAHKRQHLLQALRPGDRRRLDEIAPNPLILTVMAVVHTHEGELPDARALVYEKCIDLLLIRWELERGIQGRAQKRSLLDALAIPRITLDNALQEIAYRAHEVEKRPGVTDGQAALVTEDLLAGLLRAAFGDPGKVETFLDYSQSANGLLMLQGVAPLPDAPQDAPPRKVYAFPHLTFEEYLAGRYLRRLPNRAARVREHLDRSDRWREPVMLLGEHLCFRDGDFEPMDQIIDRLVPPEPPAAPTPADWRAAWMAGDLLMLYRRALQGRPPCDDHVVRRLADLVQAGALTPLERAAAGRALAVLGDPRPGVGVDVGARLALALSGGQVQDLPLPDTHLPLPDIQWRFVPAGPFVMGASRTETRLIHPGTGEPLTVPPDPLAYEDEGPVHIQDIPYDYWISRYPVTNAQFRCFIEDDGYEKPDWWSKSGWGWRQQTGHRGPVLYGGAFDLDNHPVVGVTWYEAAAFCGWLTAKLRMANSVLGDGQGHEVAMGDLPFVIRLPQEAEWEKAARGGLLIPTTQPPNDPTTQPSNDPIAGLQPNPNPARRYPWGETPQADQIDSERANYDQTLIGSTSAVGCFPWGAGPYGCLDMAGNVWEWCATQWEDNYKNYKNNNDAEGEIPRVLRGGAFHLDGWNLRCASRDWNYPNSVYWSWGFRVLAAFPVLAVP